MVTIEPSPLAAQIVVALGVGFIAFGWGLFRKGRGPGCMIGAVLLIAGFLILDHGLSMQDAIRRRAYGADAFSNDHAKEFLAARPTGIKEVKSERQPAIIEAATEMHRRWVAMINFHDGTGNEAQEVYAAYTAAFAHLTTVCELYRNETLNARAALKGVKSDEQG